MRETLDERQLQCARECPPTRVAGLPTGACLAARTFRPPDCCRRYLAMRYLQHNFRVRKRFNVQRCALPRRSFAMLSQRRLRARANVLATSMPRRRRGAGSVRQLQHLLSMSRRPQLYQRTMPHRWPVLPGFRLCQGSIVSKSCLCRDRRKRRPMWRLQQQFRMCGGAAVRRCTLPQRRPVLSKPGLPYGANMRQSSMPIAARKESLL